MTKLSNFKFFLAVIATFVIGYAVASGVAFIIKVIATMF